MKLTFPFRRPKTSRGRARALVCGNTPRSCLPTHRSETDRAEKRRDPGLVAVRVATAAIAAIAAIAGCAGNLEDPGRFADGGAGPGAASDDAASATDAALRDTGAAATPDAAACGDVPQTVFLPSCTSAGCHNAQDKEQGLDLQSPNPASRLIGVPSSEGQGLLIDPSSPAQSVLYTKLSANPPFGGQMPPKGALDDATIACVLSWITEVSQANDAGEPGGDASADGGIVSLDGGTPESGP